MEIILNILECIVDWSVFLFPSSGYLCADNIQTCDSVRDIVCGIVQNNKDFIYTTSIKLFHHFEAHDLELLKEFSLS